MHRFRRSEVFDRPGVPVSAERMAVSDASAAHGHDFFEFAVVAGGTGIHVGHRHRRRLEPGSVLAVRPGQWHGYVEAVELDVFNVYVDAGLFARELAWTTRDPGLARLVLHGGQTVDPLPSPARRRTVHWLTELANGADRTDPGEAIRRVGLLTCVLAECSGLALAGMSGQPTDRGLTELVVAATAQLSAELARPWTVRELAASVHVSEGHLSRLFTSQVGTPPMAWLARMRAERAAALLLESDLPIAEVGARVGWPDANYAARRFKAVHGVSPSAYRARFARAG